jgi:hypothetical protein
MAVQTAQTAVAAPALSTSPSGIDQTFLQLKPFDKRCSSAFHIVCATFDEPPLYEVGKPPSKW